MTTGEHPLAKDLRKARKRIGRSRRALVIAFTAAFLALHGQDALAEKVAHSSNSVWIQSLLFGALLAVAYGIIGAPFSYLGYRVERRFGLSTQTTRAWISDQIKGAFLGALIGTIILMGLVASLIYGKHGWWWIATLGATLFGILLTRLAPQLILPIFFKLKPIASTELQNRFKALADRTRTPVLGIFEIDLSRRTRAANAAVIGFGATRKAVVGDTLLSEFTHDEVEFVLAHELAHHRYNDLWWGILFGALTTTVSLFGVHVLLHPLFGLDESAYSPTLLFAIGVGVSVIGALLSPIDRALSRRAESRADRFAAESTRNSQAGAEAFRKLGYQNMAVFAPPAWEELLFYTHPSIARRIERLVNI